MSIDVRTYYIHTCYNIKQWAQIRFKVAFELHKKLPNFLTFIHYVLREYFNFIEKFYKIFGLIVSSTYGASNLSLEFLWSFRKPVFGST